MTTCTNCANLQAQVVNLQAQNQRLLIEVAMLKRIIEEARAECIRLSIEADTITAGHVSRGRWAYADGQGKAACAILDRLS